eukprot:scaffold175444_cov50-Tisochrysis_lutea.AAC.3
MFDHSHRLMFRIARRRVALEEGDEVGCVAEAERRDELGFAASDSDSRGLVIEVADGAVGGQAENRALVED